MRSLLLGSTLVVLLVVSTAVGVLAADWPFWRRAHAWMQAPSGGPEQLPGASVRIPGAPRALPVSADAGEARAVLGELEALLSPSELAALRARPDTQALLVARDGRLLQETYAPGMGAATLMQGRDLGVALLGIAYGFAVRDGQIRSLDEPLALYVPEWANDARGAITLRQALWELSGIEIRPLHAWNPFVRAARLASGPDFDRAALAHRRNYPAGSHFARAPANAQVLALALVRATSTPLAEYVQRTLWSPIGAGEAWFALDRVGGRAAAHCCMRATARDWLRVGMLLERSGPSDASADATADPRLPAGWLAEMTRASPVNPGYGLGIALDGPPPLGALHLAGHGRRIWVVPSRGIVVLHFVAGDFEDSGSR